MQHYHVFQQEVSTSKHTVTLLEARLETIQKNQDFIDRDLKRERGMLW